MGGNSSSCVFDSFYEFIEIAENLKDINKKYIRNNNVLSIVLSDNHKMTSSETKKAANYLLDRGSKVDISVLHDMLKKGTNLRGCDFIDIFDKLILNGAGLVFNEKHVITLFIKKCRFLDSEIIYLLVKAFEESIDSKTSRSIIKNLCLGRTNLKFEWVLNVLKLIKPKEIKEFIYKDRDALSLYYVYNKQYNKEESIQMTEFLLSAGVDVTKQDSGGWYLLHRIISYNSEIDTNYVVGCAELLLKAGANVNLPGNNKYTPLSQLLSGNTKLKINEILKVIVLFTQYGLDMNTTENKEAIERMEHNDSLNINQKKNILKLLGLYECDSQIIPKFAIADIIAGIKANNKECSVCFTDFNEIVNDDITILNCFHAICTKCLDRLNDNKCPECRKEI